MRKKLSETKKTRPETLSRNQVDELTYAVRHYQYKEAIDPVLSKVIEEIKVHPYIRTVRRMQMSNMRLHMHIDNLFHYATCAPHFGLPAIELKIIHRAKLIQSHFFNHVASTFISKPYGRMASVFRLVDAASDIADLRNAILANKKTAARAITVCRLFVEIRRKMESDQHLTVSEIKQFALFRHTLVPPPPVAWAYTPRDYENLFFLEQMAKMNDPIFRKGICNLIKNYPLKNYTDDHC
ncbi:MAG: hypothetical protein P0Y53_01295 [Candidatus Pseudobacter hemicellulosilyticus]|uniref:Uncharacterized protein n=1 Tax=Candidatus Pseudobacter hemicellulosilyticus TaxID=3121375 RepID=A0AAJ5WUZ3_9BACT|nr:MAG: hypothetical protein P0Y53_01295 [Pseudobacter sp.]